MESKRLQTAKKYINHFETLDTDTLASVLAPDHTHRFAPASLAFPGPLTREQFLEQSATLRKIMTGFPVTAKEYIESEASNQVTVWATSHPQFKEEIIGDDEREKWEFKGEYVFMLWMDETGDKIVRTVEFMDSNAAEHVLRPLLQRANEKVKAQSWF